MKKTIYLLLLVTLFFFQCKEAKKKTVLKKTTSTIKYAKGFDIITENGQKLLVIKKAFQSSDKSFRFKLTDKTNITNNELKTPVTNIVVTSTTHIPMIELLGEENSIIGFPNTKYISSEKTRKRIDNGKIIDIGSEQNMNTELLMDINPELVVGFSLHPNNKVYNNIKKMGIPVIFNGEWLEETPLGRAEWIKFFGALFKKEKQADSIFASVEKEYLKAKEIASKATYKPTVFSGSMFKDVWYVPAGESFVATFFKDANTNYLWKNTKGAGSLSLHFENVLEKAEEADFWIGCGISTSKEELAKLTKHCTQFNSFKQNRVYTNALVKGVTGGIKYFETAPIRPDLVLKDLIKITHKDLLKDYDLTFYKKIKD